MNILLTGGTGLIGSAIIAHRGFSADKFFVLSRRPDQAAGKLGAAVSCVSRLDEISSDTAIDAVINLAGEPIADKRWSDGQKRALRQSRIDLTRDLVRWMSSRNSPPTTLISGSAVGYYGNTGDLELDEDSASGNDFAAELCVDWEREAEAAAEAGIRVCIVRTGLVLSRRGGMLAKMRLPFKLGMGCQIGDGRQWMSWIHIEDQVEMIRCLLDKAECRGPFNLTAPNPVTNREFSKALAASVNRPCLFRAPATIIRLAMGEASDLLLGGQRVMPAKLSAIDYSFRYPELSTALSDVM